MAHFEPGEAEQFIYRVVGCRPPAICDPIGMEFAIEHGDPATRNQLIAVKLETLAAVYRTMADGAAKAAKIIGSSGK